MITLDPWQREFLETEGDKILYCGRQVGKSVICSMDAGEWAATHSKRTVLMIASTERQAYALFDKTLDYLLIHYPKMVKKGAKRPTKTKINLTNGTTIWCLPTGIKGTGIRFLTVHRLYGEEASRIPAEVWVAVTPMLLTTGGDTILLTTPAGKGTFASDVWNNKDDAYRSFKRFSIGSEEAVRKRQICNTWTEYQRDKAIEHLGRERSRLSKLFYAQEYEGKEIESLMRFFPDKIIEQCTVLKKEKLGTREGDRYLGVDIARLGEDQSVLLGVEKTVIHSMTKTRIKLKQIGMEITERTRLTRTIDMIKRCDKITNYRLIYIDDAGVGGGVFDVLLKEEQTKRKVISINNASRSLDRDEKRKKKLLKEDLYTNLLRLMENKDIELYDDDELILSLQSIQYEYTDGNMKIYGNYSHIAEALIRAAWCVQDKHLNIWVSY